MLYCAEFEFQMSVPDRAMFQSSRSRCYSALSSSFQTSVPDRAEVPEFEV